MNVNAEHVAGAHAAHSAAALVLNFPGPAETTMAGWLTLLEEYLPWLLPAERTADWLRSFRATLVAEGLL